MHIAAGAKMVPFAGYTMPVQYPNGIIREHLHTRAAAGLFDVSHMGQVIVSGGRVVAELERLLPLDIEAMSIGEQRYTLLTNGAGGIRDDLIVTRLDRRRFMLVINAACKESDLSYLRESLVRCELQVRDDYALLALQGPEAERVLAEHVPDASGLHFMSAFEAEADGQDWVVSRSGYTGEDGFEIALPAASAPKLAADLLTDPAVHWVGLGARDSLRLEAGLCLYGHDLTTQTTPLEAGLLWSISPTRRPKGKKSGGYPGADWIAQQMVTGVLRKRVGLHVEGRAPIREGENIIDVQGNIIGAITSGGYAPSLEAPIAMGYVESAFAGVGAELGVELRGKRRAVTVTAMPFVPHRYHRH